MKVAFLSKSINRAAGGLLPVMQALGTGLELHREVKVCALGVKDRAEHETDPAWDGVEAIDFPCVGPHALGYSPAMANALAERNPDLVHTHGLFYYTSHLARHYSVKKNQPYLVSPHGMLDPWALANSRWKKRMAGWIFENRHLADAACLHSLCTAETEAIRACGLKQPIVQIPNGIDIPLQLTTSLPPWHSLVEPGRKVLLYLGRIHPKKGLENLIKAWSRVMAEGDTDWVLVIAGWDQDGHSAELRKIAADMQLKRSVLFLGPQFGEDKASCYAGADAFVLPSLSEGLPMVILEAWAFGLPVLMTPQCNLPEGFASGAALSVIPQVDDLHRGLVELVTLSDNDRRLMGERGLELVKSQFSWGRITAEMLAVYTWLLGGGETPSCVIRN